MAIIGSAAKEIFLDKVKDFKFDYGKIEKRNNLRQEFVQTFSTEKVKNLKPEDYFPGMGNKKGNMGYELEWATRELGSIRGGSIAKYGIKTKFPEIKKLIISLMGFKDEVPSFYENDGQLSPSIKEVIIMSQKIKGLSTGRVLLSKILSIYYPKTFIQTFSDQDHFLNKIIDSYLVDYRGLELYLRNNYLLLQVKDELFSDPIFIQSVENENYLHNDFFYDFLYFCFPKDTEVTGVTEVEEAMMGKHWEVFEDYYQKIIHKNFSLFFPGLKYLDEETQNGKNGKYDTGEVGEMDFLCLDSKNNYVVLELKKRGTDQTVGQILRYMGWVLENLVEDNQKVSGLIVTEEKDTRLEYALKIVPSVKLKKMEIDLKIKDY